MRVQLLERDDAHMTRSFFYGGLIRLTMFKVWVMVVVMVVMMVVVVLVEVGEMLMREF